MYCTYGAGEYIQGAPKNGIYLLQSSQCCLSSDFTWTGFANKLQSGSLHALHFFQQQ